MEETNMTTKKALLIVGGLISVLVVSLIMPAKWFGVTPPKSNQPTLILRDRDELAALAGDKNNNNNPDWKDLLLETTHSPVNEKNQPVTISPEVKKRLADPNNLTASFSKNVVVASAYAKKNGTLTKVQQSELIRSLIAGEAKKIVVTSYTVDDIVIAQEDTLTTKKTYGNALGKLVKKAETANLGTGDTEILKAFMSSKDASLLEAFVVKKNVTESIIATLLKTPTPRSAVIYHLLAINNLSFYKTTLEGLAQASNDPIRASIAFDNYLGTVRGIFSALQRIDLYFKQENVTFTSTEPGYILTPGYTKK